MGDRVHSATAELKARPEQAQWCWRDPVTFAVVRTFAHNQYDRGFEPPDRKMLLCDWQDKIIARFESRPPSVRKAPISGWWLFGKQEQTVL